MEKLLALQQLQLRSKALSPADEREVSKLREGVPAPVLGHFDRLIARGKKGVAHVRHGVCAECHIRASTGTLGTLAAGTDIQLCGNCGRYLYLPEDEAPFAKKPQEVPVPAPASKPGRRKKEKTVHAG
ncbi:MAG: hypothetical protein KGJ60_09460 [Verrucomicrobiota bacterium]|nr:hypothetical protein [Verrucomicrobiota bacterium]